MQSLGRLVGAAVGVLSLLLSGTVAPARAANEVFGPEVFVRDTGEPRTEVRTFAVKDLEQPFTLTVRNGDGTGARISSAVIMLNGVMVVGPQAFNQQVVVVSREVTLASENKLSVEVRSRPGSSIVVELAGIRPQPVPGTVRGLVFAPDGAPAGGAAVGLAFTASGDQFQTVTDSAGLFALTDLLTGGAFALTASTPDGAAASAVGSVTPESPEAVLTLVLARPGPGRVSGAVRTPAGEPVASAAVTISFFESGFTASTLADPSGAFVLAGLPTDGSFALVAFDAGTAASGSRIDFLTADRPSVALDVTVAPPAAVNAEFTNSGFQDGTLSGWETEGDVRLVPQASVFEEAPATAGEPAPLGAPEGGTVVPQQTPCQPSPFSAVVSTAAGNRAVGQLSQTFMVRPGDDTLVGWLRFVSNEWPVYYGSQYNDAFTVTLTTPSGARILAQGNLNSSAWGPGVAGFNGATAQIEVAVDVAAFQGKAVTLTVVVSDVGDLVVDSGVVVSNFRVIDRDNRNFYAAGAWNADTSFTEALGQAVWITVKNLNVLGTTIVVDSNHGQEQRLILLPQQSHTFYFAVFSSEPVGWEFDVSTLSDAFIVTYRIESTWIPGMPPNPCF
jgi:hypothetical protein